MKIHLPHPIVLLTGCVFIAAGLSYILPAGQFDRRFDEATGRTVVVPGTYHAVESSPVNLFEAVVALPRGMAAAGDVIFLVFLVGGAFTVVDETGVLRRSVTWLAGRLPSGGLVVIPIVSLFFAAGGVVENMAEEIIALVPVLLVLTRRFGFTPMVAVSMSAGAAAVGSAFSPINPFQVQIAQKIAELPLGSGGVFRTVVLVLALALWIGWTMRYASRNRLPAENSETIESGASSRDGIILGLIGVTFGIAVWGMSSLDWGFNELSAAFFVMGIAAGAVGGLGVNGTAKAYAKGFQSMAFAAMLIGFARAIFVVLDDGKIVDTIVNGLFAPLQGLPLMASTFGLVVAQAIIHIPVPSVSGQAVLTMPLVVPLSDLLGLSRQVAVLAYQYGGGLCDLVTPTNGALVAIVGLTGLRFEDWLKFAMPLYLVLVALGLVAIAMGIITGL